MPAFMRIVAAMVVVMLASPAFAVGFQYLPTRMNGHVPEYTYTLEKGITDDRHGMIIIRNEGILDILENGKKL